MTMQAGFTNTRGIWRNRWPRSAWGLVGMASLVAAPAWAKAEGPHHHAHEAAHTVQQSSGRAAATPQPTREIEKSDTHKGMKAPAAPPPVSDMDGDGRAELRTAPQGETPAKAQAGDPIPGIDITAPQAEPK